MLVIHQLRLARGPRIPEEVVFHSWVYLRLQLLVEASRIHDRLFGESELVLSHHFPTFGRTYAGVVEGTMGNH